MSMSFGRFRRTLAAAMAAREEGRTEEAIRLCQAARGMRAKDPRPLLHQALALAAAGRLTEAVPLLEKARVLGRDPAMVHLFEGLARLEGRDPAGAFGAFLAAQELEPENRLARSGAALARWDGGERRAAAAALLADPFVHAAFFEAEILLRVERYTLEQARGRNEPLPLYEPWTREEEPGNRSFLGKIARAWKLRRARRFRARAEKCASRGMPLDELEWIDRVLALDPADGSLLKERARARRQALKAARRRFRKEAADLEPCYEVGCLSVLCGEHEEGLRRLNAWLKALRGEGNVKADAWHVEYGLALAAQAQAALGRFRAAEESLSELCGLNTLDAYPRYLLGRCRLAAGDEPGAARAFQEALHTEPAFARGCLRTLTRREGWEESAASGNGEGREGAGSAPGEGRGAKEGTRREGE